MIFKTNKFVKYNDNQSINIFNRPYQDIKPM